MQEGAAGEGAAGGPRMVTCYACGKQFGPSSLGIHVTQCLRKRAKQQQEVGDAQLRGASPEAPAMPFPSTSASLAEVQAYNSLAEAAYKASMPKCRHCGRTFEDAERLGVHLKSCKAAEGAAPAGGASGGSGAGAAGEGAAGGPRMVTCYACGKQFGPSSLGIHVTQCLRKRAKQQQEVGDAQLRGASPEAPAMPFPSTSASLAEVQAYNSLAEAAYKASMPKCRHCGRTFEDAERLGVHLKSCKAAEGAAPAGGASGGSGAGAAGEGAAGGPRMVTCYACGKQFGPSSLGIHVTQCLRKRAKQQQEVGDAQLRGASPEAPAMPFPSTSASLAEVQAYNSLAEAAYKASMPKCRHCGRTFEDAERLGVHLKSCKAAEGAAPAGGASGGSGAGAAGEGAAGGPRMVTCYACGKQFGPSSLGIHVTQCLRKRAKQQQEVGDAQLRGASPEAPAMPFPSTSASLAEVQAYNSLAEAAYKASMPKCRHCGRTFEDAERLGVHLKSCKAAEGAAPAGGASGGSGAGAAGEGAAGGPRMVTCYACGKQFGPSSLGIHVTQCLRKRAKQQQEVGDAQLRGASPEAPAMPFPSTSASLAEVQAYNSLAEAAYKASMPKCRHCGRTFEDAERLGVHLKSCKAAEGAAPAGGASGGSGAGAAGEGAAGGPRMVTCYACGKQFGPSSLGIHVTQCLRKRAKQQQEVGDAQLRGASPEAPAMPFPSTSASLAEVQAYNSLAEAAYKASMPKCRHCGRTFEDAERLAGEGAAGGPRMVTCYACGKQFGPSSLGIHVTQCLRKRAKQQQEVGDAQLRGASPEAPAMPFPSTSASLAEVQAYNSLAEAAYKASMPKCRHCGRTFEDAERLGVHLKSCKAAEGAAPAGGASGGSGAGAAGEGAAVAVADIKPHQSDVNIMGRTMVSRDSERLTLTSNATACSSPVVSTSPVMSLMAASFADAPSRGSTPRLSRASISPHPLPIPNQMQKLLDLDVHPSAEAYAPYVRKVFIAGEGCLGGVASDATNELSPRSAGTARKPRVRVRSGDQGKVGTMAVLPEKPQKHPDLVAGRKMCANSRTNEDEVIEEEGARDDEQYMVEGEVVSHVDHSDEAVDLEGIIEDEELVDAEDDGADESSRCVWSQLLEDSEEDEEIVLEEDPFCKG
ncbi:hypothetical protein CYMTET_52759 [Cymbomonas tetramitiformis]|uniref:C2H2-type domain-containing protein n=1 Tax=Cymbomonas tetramitiformis TaxID=36881 RepID=A0AAE0ER13_9CHLO|nr:hypothetical protein CYMTET_52759 [Cymbomonas tetramitiformis]